MSVVSGRDTLTSVATCNGTNVSSYEIDCGNGQKFTGSGSNSGVENFTETCNYSGNRTYTPTCRINGEAQVPTCSSTVTLN